MSAKRILLVEDNSLIRRQVCDVLREADPELLITEVTDGAAAVSALFETCPDLVMLDLFMPKMSGLEAIVKMREQVRDLKVLIVSSLDTESMKQQCLDAGAVGFLGKPFHPVELVATVRRCLE